MMTMHSFYSQLSAPMLPDGYMNRLAALAKAGLAYLRPARIERAWDVWD